MPHAGMINLDNVTLSINIIMRLEPMEVYQQYAEVVEFHCD